MSAFNSYVQASHYLELLGAVKLMS
jgi:hypothetical protein